MSWPIGDRQMVLVEWIDSNTANGWHDVESMRATVTQDCLCKSVGWLFIEAPDRIVLVPNQSQTGQVADATTIPRLAVVSVTPLVEAPQGTR